MRSTLRSIPFFALSALAAAVFTSVSFAADDSARVPREQLPPHVVFEEEDPTLATPPVPQGNTLPPDDTKLIERPAVQLILRTGVDGFIPSSQKGIAETAAAMLLLQGGDLELLIKGQASGVLWGSFDGAEGSLRLERRYPIDEKRHLFWWGFGGNIEGRYAKNAALDSYVRAQPVALLGVMHAFIPQECLMYFFAKGAVGLVDTQTAGTGFLDKYFRPAVGAEGYARCDRWRVFVDFQHVFDVGSWTAATDKVLLEFSKTWPVKGWLEIGFFGKGDYTSERAGAVDRAVPEVLPGTSRGMGRVQGGLEIRY